MNKTKQEILKTLILLYIEDEDAIRESMIKTLEIIFKHVIAFGNAEEAYLYYKNTKIDIIISDINLPNMSGIDFTKLVRKDDYKIPIILLTAYSKTDTLMEATRLKLVNYITKPIIYEELYDSLNMAVEEILRFKDKIFKLYDNVIYDLSLKILYQNNKEVHLTSSENRLLILLLKNVNKTVTIDMIKNELWNDPIDATESALKSILTKLRSKVGKQSIRNVSGVGYYIQAKLDLQ